FDKKDHRNFNRDGKFFDVGETFSGIPYETGIEAVERLKKVVPDNVNLVHLALKWTLMRDEVSVVIPGASSDKHVTSNCDASETPPIPDEIMKKIDEIYEEMIKPHVHQRW
ncbi:MAG: aldo/keto reductase, partial [Balneolaceae bacterium]|nr:aldo/keto reductase [Balneolaceae bacterium]